MRLACKLNQIFRARPGGGGVLPYILYMLYRYVPPSRVEFLRCSVLKLRVSFSVFFDIVILRCSLDRVTKLQYPPQRAKRKRYGLLQSKTVLHVIKFNKVLLKGRL